MTPDGDWAAVGAAVSARMAAEGVDVGAGPRDGLVGDDGPGGADGAGRPSGCHAVRGQYRLAVAAGLPAAGG